MSGFPIVLTDGSGASWSISPDGRIDTGGAPSTTRAFDAGFDLTYMPNVAAATPSEAGREWTMTGPSSSYFETVTYTRSVLVPDDLPHVRYLDTATNTGTQAITATLALYFDLGGSFGQRVTWSSSGDIAFGADDTALVLADSGSALRPAVALAIGDGNANTIAPNYAAQSTDKVLLQWQVQLAPGQSASILTFGAQAADASALEALAGSLGGPVTEDMVRGLSEIERAQIINYDLTLLVFEIQGTPGDDTLDGSNDRERFLAFDGADTVHGAGGDDEAVGGAGNDSLDGGEGADTLDGGLGDDLLSGGAGADALTGGDGFDFASYADSATGVTVTLDGAGCTGGSADGDTLSEIEGVIGSDHADMLIGCDGDNVFRPGRGNDTVDGGLGWDMLDLGAMTMGVHVSLTNNAVRAGASGIKRAFGIEAVTGSDWSDTIRGSTGDEYMAGGAGADILTSLGGADTLQGGRGADTLRGDSGDEWLDGGADGDRIFGGAGADMALGMAGEDTLFGDSGDDTLLAGDGDDYADGGAGADAVDGGDGADTLVGGDGDDTLTGGGAADFLSGRDGDDSLSGGKANDTLWGADGADRLEGDGGHDRLNGWSGADLLDGGAGADTLRGGGDSDTLGGAEGDDFLHGNEGDDFLAGDMGNDTLRGGTGDDTISGGAGDDWLVGGQGNDSLDGGGGRDTLSGWEGNDTLNGSGGQDTLRGGDGADRLFASGNHDVLYGEAGDDTLDGQSGRDTLVGGSGVDVLTGGTDADVFRFLPGPDEDRVTDFTPGVDLIDLTAFSGWDYARVIASASSGPAGLWLNMDGMRVLLEGVEIAEVSATDLLF